MYFQVTGGNKKNRILKNHHWLRSPISLRGCWHLCWVLRPLTVRLALLSDYSTWFGPTQQKTTSFIWNWISYCMTTLNAPTHQKEVCCNQTWFGMDGPFSWSLKWYQIYDISIRDSRAFAWALQLSRTKECADGPMGFPFRTFRQLFEPQKRL